MGTTKYARPSARIEAYEAIDRERDYQYDRWGSGEATTPDEYAVRIAVYSHRLNRHLAAGDTKEAGHAMRKIAALAVASMEHGVIRTRESETETEQQAVEEMLRRQRGRRQARREAALALLQEAEEMLDETDGDLPAFTSSGDGTDAGMGPTEDPDGTL